MSEYILIIMLGCLGLYLIRVFIGPSAWDRLLAMNLISVKVLIVLILLATIEESTFFLDVAIVCILLGFIGTIFISQFIREKIEVEKRQ